MGIDMVSAEVELRNGDRVVRVTALVDTDASRNIISRRLADRLQAYTPIRKPYKLRTADRDGEMWITGFCTLEVVFQGVEVPGGARFEVADNLREDIELIIGRPEIDAWNIIFTPEGPKPRKTPIEFEII